MQIKKKNKLFWWILTILFIIYIALTIAMKNGYYESKLNEKAVLTEEAIKKFEEDIKNGKEVDIDKYINASSVDYNNKISKAGLTFSKKSEELMTDGIDNLIKFLGYLFGG